MDERKAEWVTRQGKGRELVNRGRLDPPFHSRERIASNVYSITTLRAYLAPFASLLMVSHVAVLFSSVFTTTVIAKKPPHTNPMDFSLVLLYLARHLRSMFAASFVAVEPSRSYPMNHRLVTLDAARPLRSMFAASFVAV